MSKITLLAVALGACGSDTKITQDASGDANDTPDAAADGPASVVACANATATDDFERTTLGNAWMEWVNAQCAANGSDLVQQSSSAWCYAVYSTTFTADQFSEAAIAADKPPQILTQVFVRQQPVGTPSGNGARYGFHYNADPGKAQWEIKYDGVTTTETRVWMNTTAPPPVPGDRIRVEVRGSNPVVVRGFHNGIELVVATDAAAQRIATTGHSGVVERPAGGSTPPPPNSPVFESWCGGPL